MVSYPCSISLIQRITISDIIEDPWFQTDYKPVFASEFDQNINLEGVDVAFNSIEVICWQTSKLEIVVEKLTWSDAPNCVIICASGKCQRDNGI